MADALALGSQRVLPRKLEQLGYHFLHPALPEAMRFVLRTS
jgi:NAD dependent epimerase/dehydratase family enzyme